VSDYSTRLLLSTRLIAGGIKSYLPVRKTYTGTGGSDSARYCYAAWLRHLVSIGRVVPDLRPRVVAELGPGDSLGLGLAALLSGAERYLALDVLAHTNVDVNLEVLDALAPFFRDRADIPSDEEFPELYPRVGTRSFPDDVLRRMALKVDASDERVASLRRAISGIAEPSSAHAAIRYLCPWPTAAVEPGSVDLIVTQAVLQDMDHRSETDALTVAFKAMAGWLKRGGVMSHQVNLAFPDTTWWNQHWMYGELTWTLIRGRRPYYVNRVPASEYLRLCEEHGFEVVAVTPVAADDSAPRSKLPRRFRDLPTTDYSTRAVHFVARKR
jgi:hypothetical protein